MILVLGSVYLSLITLFLFLIGLHCFEGEENILCCLKPWPNLGKYTYSPPIRCWEEVLPLPSLIAQHLDFVRAQRWRLSKAWRCLTEILGQFFWVLTWLTHKSILMSKWTYTHRNTGSIDSLGSYFRSSCTNKYYIFKKYTHCIWNVLN